MGIKKFLIQKEVRILFLVFLLAFAKEFYDRNKFVKEGVFVLGKIIKIGYGETGNYCNYKYNYNGKIYVQNGNIGHNQIPNEGDIFLVILKKEFPYYSRIILKAPIDKKLVNKEISYYSWDTIPFNIDKKVIDDTFKGFNKFWDTSP